MHIDEFAGRILEAADAVGPLIRRDRAIKKLVDLAVDTVVPVKDDGTPYTTPELIETVTTIADQFEARRRGAADEAKPDPEVPAIATPAAVDETNPPNPDTPAAPADEPAAPATQTEEPQS